MRTETLWTSSIPNQGTWVGSSSLPTPSPSHTSCIEVGSTLEEGREPHRVITGLNSLNSTIQSPVAGEEIGEGALYWIERGTLLVDLLSRFCASLQKGQASVQPIPSLNCLLLTRRQRRFNYLNILFCDSH